MPGAWRSRPVFVSSTFKDMHAERDWLQRHAFPRLEEALRQRRHHLEPIDLRLGTETAAPGSEEARELAILKVCLEEIRRSRPFMVVLLGDRYGWVPPAERSEAAVTEQGFATQIAGKSVTALEIEFGIIREDPEQQHRSLFFLRRPLPYARMPGDVAENYCDACASDPHVRSGHGRLIELKQRLQKDAALGFRVFEYSANWDETAQRVTGLEAFGELVFEKLWDDLEEETRRYLEQAPESWQDQERFVLSDFCEHRGRRFIGREAVVEKLLALAHAPEGDSRGACVTGPAGVGKSALFSELYHRLGGNGEVFLLANAAGGTLRGSSVESMLVRWTGELCNRLGIADPLSEKPTTEELDEAFYSCLNRVCADQRVVVLMDALDQFEAGPRGRHLAWLNWRRWPGKRPADRHGASGGFGGRRCAPGRGWNGSVFHP